MKNYFDHAADSTERRKAARGLEKGGQRHLDSARQTLHRIEQANRRKLYRQVRLKVALGVVLTLVTIYCIVYVR